MLIPTETQKLFAESFKKARSVDSFKKDMEKIVDKEPIKKLAKSIKHRQILKVLKGR